MVMKKIKQDFRGWVGVKKLINKNFLNQHKSWMGRSERRHISQIYCRLIPLRKKKKLKKKSRHGPDSKDANRSNAGGFGATIG
jgi:hypothetical protein